MHLLCTDASMITSTKAWKLSTGTLALARVKGCVVLLKQTPLHLLSHRHPQTVTKVNYELIPRKLWLHGL